MKILSILLCLLLSASSAARTRYVSYTNGADTNDGLTTATPWKHAPGMQGLHPDGTSTGDSCSNNCAAFTPIAGDSIIMLGGDVWPSTVMPWSWTWSGGSSSSTYGCAGASCIFIGSAVDAGMPAWNMGKVTSITLKRDLGGWSAAAPPSISCSGGGGTGASATPQVVPAAQTDSLIAGMLYHVALTSAGSGYTSAPTCTLSGTNSIGSASTQGILVADIDRPIIDLGGTGGSPVIWFVGQSNSHPTTFSPGVNLSANYIRFSGVEVRNMMMAQNTFGGLDNIHTVLVGGGAHSTYNNLYVHGQFVSCVTATPCSLSQDVQYDAIGVGSPYDEASNNYVENGDAGLMGTATTEANGVCANGAFCTFGTFGIATGTQAGNGPVSVHHNRIWANSWQIRMVGTSSTSDPFLNYNNETWLTLANINKTAHINRQYSQLTRGTFYSYNNIDHNHYAGSGNQQQLPTGVTLYFFNWVVWGTGTSTPAFGFDPNCGGACSGGGTAYVLNNTIYNPTSNYVCFNSGNASTATTVVTQNNHCITGPSALNPFWGGATNVTFQNSTGSSVQANVQAASIVQSITTANSQGYTQSNLFAPTAGSNDTITFATSGNSNNYTSQCTGFLTALCNDVLGNARPSSNGWQAGAYSFSTPAITSFTSSGDFNYGGSSLLTFNTINCSSASINNGVGAVSCNGTSTVSPKVTTCYILTITGPLGDTVNQSVCIFVSAFGILH